MEEPIQIVEFAETVTTSSVFTTTLVLALLIQPLELVAVKVYAPVFKLLALLIVGFCRLLV
jgi:hypothetical protein